MLLIQPIVSCTADELIHRVEILPKDGFIRKVYNLYIHSQRLRHGYVVFPILTLKKAFVEPEPMLPYLILVCLARSSALWMADSIRSTVRKAAKLAV